jgi:hypothetical protein
MEKQEMRIKDFDSTEELQAFVESMRWHSTLTPLRDVELLQPKQGANGLEWDCGDEYAQLRG